MPPLADHRLVALRQIGDEFVRVGRARRRDDLLVRRLGIAEAQIVQHRAVEQIGVLHHHRHPAADLREAQRVELAPAQPNSPLLRHVDPLQQPEQRRLARARAPHHAHAAPRRRAEAHLAQRVPPPRRVGERDRVELQLRAQLIGARVRRRVGHLRLRVGHFQHALRGRHAEQPLVEQLAQFAQRTENLHAQHQHDQQLGDLHRPVLHPHRAQRQRHRRPHRDRQNRQPLRHRVVQQHAHRRAKDLLRARRQRVATPPALPERLQRRQPLNRVQKVGGERSVGVAPAQARRRVLSLQQRRQREREQREAHVNRRHRQIEEGHKDEDADRRDRRHQQLRQILPEERLQLLHALDHPDRHIARAPPVEIGRAQRHHPLEQPLAQAELHLHRGAVGQLLLGVEQPRAGQRDQRRGDDQPAQRAERIALENPRAHPAQQRQACHARRHRQQTQRHRRRDPRPHPVREAPQLPGKRHRPSRLYPSIPPGGSAARSPSAAPAARSTSASTPRSAAATPPAPRCRPAPDRS